MSTREVVAERTASALNTDTATLKRMVGYGTVGATGIVVDLSIVERLSVLGVHHLLAITVAYFVAMTWNFVWQRQLVYRAGGNPIRQYIRYQIVDVSAFAVRAGAVIALVDLSDPFQAVPYLTALDPAVPASFVGIVLAFAIGFGGTDTIVFGRWTETDG